MHSTCWAKPVGRESARRRAEPDSADGLQARGPVAPRRRERPSTDPLRPRRRAAHGGWHDATRRAGGGRPGSALGGVRGRAAPDRPSADPHPRHRRRFDRARRPDRGAAPTGMYVRRDDRRAVTRGPSRAASLRVLPGDDDHGTRPTELVVEIRFRSPPGTVSVLEEFAERAGDFALASVCVAAARDEAGICTWSGSGWGPSPPPQSGRRPPGRLPRLASRRGGERCRCAVLAREIRPRGGLHVPAEYRAELTAVLLRRAVARIYAQSASAVSA